MRPSLLFAVLGLVVLVPGIAAAQQAEPAKADLATVALRDLYTSEWNWRQQEFGYQSEDGEWQSTDRFPSNTPEAWDRRTTYRSEEQTSELQSLMRISYADSSLQKNKAN